MPRFEDLMDKQGRIRLRTRREPLATLHQYLNTVCRGWQMVPPAEYDFCDDATTLTLCFRRPPDHVDDRGRVRTIADGKVTTHQMYAEADFDAMLAALEPYTLIRPVWYVANTVGNYKGGWRHEMPLYLDEAERLSNECDQRGCPTVQRLYEPAEVYIHDVRAAALPHPRTPQPT